MGHRSSSLLSALRSEVPPSAVRLAQVPGLTLRRIRALHAGLGIESVEQLRQACETGRVRELRDFGVKTEQKLLRALALHEQGQREVVLLEALRVLRRLVVRLPGRRVEASGDARRYEATVRELSLVVEADDAERLWAELGYLPDVLECRPDRGELLLVGGYRVKLRLANADHFGAAQLAATGRPSHTSPSSSGVPESEGADPSHAPARVQDLGSSPGTPALAPSAGGL